MPEQATAPSDGLSAAALGAPSSCALATLATL